MFWASDLWYTEEDSPWISVETVWLYRVDIKSARIRKGFGQGCCLSPGLLNFYREYVGRDISVGIATRYGQDGPGIESRWGRDFPHLSRPVLWPTQPPIQWVPALFPGGKAAGTWHWPPTPSSAEVKERVDLYLYSPSGPSWPVQAVRSIGEVEM